MQRVLSNDIVCVAYGALNTRTNSASRDTIQIAL